MWYLSIQKCTHKQINLAPYLITYHQRSPFLYVPFMKSLIISEPLTSSMTHVGSWMLSQTYLGTPSMLSLPPSLQALIILGVSWEYCPHNQGSGLNIQRRELYPSTIEMPKGWQKTASLCSLTVFFLVLNRWSKNTMCMSVPDWDNNFPSIWYFAVTAVF